MTLTDIALYIIVPIIAVSILLTFARLLIGPTVPDRVVALDAMTTLGLAVIVLFAIIADQSVFLEVATVMALTTFLGTIAFAYYIEQRIRESLEDD